MSGCPVSHSAGRKFRSARSGSSSERELGKLSRDSENAARLKHR